MSKVAICNAESGQLTDICDEADKFAIYEGPDATLKWVDVPEDTTYEHFMCNGVVIHRETTEDLRESLDEAFEDFLDEKSKESAIGKISSLLNDFDDKTLEMLKDIKQTQTEAFEKALDPEEKKSKINVLRDQLKDHTEKELESLTKKLDEVLKKLNIQETEEALIDEADKENGEQADS